MPQGRPKGKAKSPAKKKAVKGGAVTKRANRPATPKKGKGSPAQKLKRAITKTVNEAAEEEIRAQALDGKKSASPRGKAVSTPAAASPAKKGKAGRPPKRAGGAASAAGKKKKGKK